MAGFILQDGQIVLNIPGIGAPPKPDKSWRQYWIDRSGSCWPEECSNEGCTNQATDGGLVMVPSILPLCHGCNIGKANQLLKVGGNTIAVPLYHSLS